MWRQKSTSKSSREDVKSVTKLHFKSVVPSLVLASMGVHLKCESREDVVRLNQKVLNHNALLVFNPAEGADELGSDP